MFYLDEIRPLYEPQILVHPPRGQSEGLRLDDLDPFDRQGLARGGKNGATFIDEAFQEIETRSGFEK